MQHALGPVSTVPGGMIIGGEWRGSWQSWHLDAGAHARAREGGGGGGEGGSWSPGIAGISAGMAWAETFSTSTILSFVAMSGSHHEWSRMI
jgi:hypothetical protein